MESEFESGFKGFKAVKIESCESFEDGFWSCRKYTGGMRLCSVASGEMAGKLRVARDGTETRGLSH